MKLTVSPKDVQTLLERFIQVPHPQEDSASVKSFVKQEVRSSLPDDFFDHVTVAENGELVATKLFGNYEQSETGRENQPPLFLFLTYGATYPAGTMKDPYTPQVSHGGEWGYEEDVIRGRGLTEQVSSLAAAAAAMKTLASSTDWNGRPIELAFATTISGETGDHVSAENVIKMLRRSPTWTVVCVATNCQVGIGNKGRVDVHLKTQGKSSHSSAPENGKNALIDACKVIQVLGRESLPSHSELGNAALTPISIRSFPDSPHTIPDRCNVTFDRRLIPGENPEQVVRSIEQTLESYPELNVSVQRGKYMHPNQLDPHTSFCKTAVDAVKVNELNRTVVYQKSAQDAGYFTHIGSETLCLGPGDRRFAHTQVEVVPIRHVWEMAQAYFDIFLELGKSGTE